MEYFIFGYLSAVLTFFLVGTVIGIVYLFKVRKKLNELQSDQDNLQIHIDTIENNIYREMGENQGNNSRLLEDSLRENKEKISSMIDSRMDKLRESVDSKIDKIKERLVTGL